MAERTYTKEELAACAEREVGQRRRVYPRLVERGGMRQDFADAQLGMMQAIARRLREEAEAEAAAGRLL